MTPGGFAVVFTFQEQVLLESGCEPRYTKQMMDYMGRLNWLTFSQAPWERPVRTDLHIHTAHIFIKRVHNAPPFFVFVSKHFWQQPYTEYHRYLLVTRIPMCTTVS